MISSKQLFDGSFSRFLLVGSSNFLLGMVLFQAAWLLGEPLGALRTAAAQAFSYGIGMIWSFFWNRSWAFRRAECSSHIRGEALRFFAVQISCMVISMGFVTAMIDGVGLPPLLGWPIAMAPLVLINFVLINRWVFPVRSLNGNPAENSTS